MQARILSTLFALAARLPLATNHALGALLGYAVYWLSPSYARRLRENLAGAGLAAQPGTLRANIRETGKGMLELPWVWQRPYEEVLAKVRRCDGWQHVETAHTNGRGVIFLTPHLGCFEMLSLYIAKHYPMTSLYRPPRQAFLDRMMKTGRQRGQATLAPADMSGVRLLLKALKRGECIGMLPDQAPGNGEGTWTPFFGRPAYTMTLFGRLLSATGATAILCVSERLPAGAGYALRFEPLAFDAERPTEPQLNAVLERAILALPAQYLWSYNRYKVPHGAPPLGVSD